MDKSGNNHQYKSPSTRISVQFQPQDLGSRSVKIVLERDTTRPSVFDKKGTVPHTAVTELTLLGHHEINFFRMAINDLEPIKADGDTLSKSLRDAFEDQMRRQNTSALFFVRHPDNHEDPKLRGQYRNSSTETLWQGYQMGHARALSLVKE